MFFPNFLTCKWHEIVEMNETFKRNGNSQVWPFSGFSWVMAVIAFALFVSTAEAQSRILDLGAVAPEEFSESSGLGSVYEEREDSPFSMPPAPSAPESIAEDAETTAQQVIDLALESELVNDELMNGVSGAQIQKVEHSTAYSEMPALASNKFWELTHQCTSAVTQSQAGKWIFWRSECEPGPICCATQYRFVNWRLSATYLEGCMPGGYTLSHFIQTVPQVEQHAGPLAINGPGVSQGSFADAQQLEGEETKPIQQVSINITPPEGALPHDRAATKFEELPQQQHLPGAHRLWNGQTFHWQASLLNHQPLYFEDVNLERHGFSYGCWQPVVSGAKFFGRIPALPYLMTAEPPHETSFTLGQGRPGSHACYVSERPPLRWDAAAVEAAAVVGLVFLIP